MTDVPSLLLLCTAALANKHTSAGLGRILERRFPYQTDLRWHVRLCLVGVHYTAYDCQRIQAKKRKRGGFIMGYKCYHCILRTEASKKRPGFKDES